MLIHNVCFLNGVQIAFPALPSCPPAEVQRELPRCYFQGEMQGVYTVVSQQIETCPVAMILFWGDIFAVMLNICLRETVVTTLILNFLSLTVLKLFKA